MSKHRAFEDRAQLVPDRAFLVLAPVGDVSRHKDVSALVTI